ncbi:hypothetical protein [Pontibacter liquoris]|nr:hypothetical protein [Pontibacter liquoris]
MSRCQGNAPGAAPNSLYFDTRIEKYAACAAATLTYNPLPNDRTT